MNGLNFEATAQILSLTASIIAMSSTMYFWLVRSNRERPNLDIEQLAGISASVLIPNYARDEYQLLKPADDEIILGYWFDVGVLNNSSLPNAILGVDADVLLASGRWVSALTRVTSDASLPVNISPLTTGRLSLQVYTKIKGSYANTGNREREEMAEQALSDRRGAVIRLRLRGVRQVAFEFAITRELNEKTRILKLKHAEEPEAATPVSNASSRAA